MSDKKVAIEILYHESKKSKAICILYIPMTILLVGLLGFRLFLDNNSISNIILLTLIMLIVFFPYFIGLITSILDNNEQHKSYKKLRFTFLVIFMLEFITYFILNYIFNIYYFILVGLFFILLMIVLRISFKDFNKVKLYL